MTYEPINYAPDVLLEKAGFTRNSAAAMGWTRDVQRTLKDLMNQRRAVGETILIREKELHYFENRERQNVPHRLHAIVQDGSIKMHLDYISSNQQQHFAKSFCKPVEKAIKELKAIDLSACLPATAGDTIPSTSSVSGGKETRSVS